MAMLHAFEWEIDACRKLQHMMLSCPYDDLKMLILQLELSSTSYTVEGCGPSYVLATEFSGISGHETLFRW